MSEARKKGKIRWWPWLLPTLLVLYPFSIGPAWMLVARGNLTMKTYEFVYRPMRRAAAPFPTVRGIVLDYLDLWVSSDDPSRVIRTDSRQGFF